MLSSYITPIWLYPEPVDFRKQIDGLVLLVSDRLQLDPMTGELFIFRNRQRNKLKLLWYERTGFWLCYRRLEAGRLIFPAHTNEVMEITRDQMAWLLSGLDFEKQDGLPECTASQFF
jgi:transposase